MKNMKSFRKILVHRYGKINDEEVFQKFVELEDFVEFREKVIEYLG